MSTSIAEKQDSTKAALDLDRSGWELVSFGDVALKQNTSVDREKTDLTRYVAGDHMGSEDLHLREWGVLGDDYLGPAFNRKFEEGDILYGSRRTYLRKVAVAHFNGITANTTFVIKPNEDLILKELLPFIMLSEGFSQHSIRNSKGSVNPYVNWKDVANYEFLLPPKRQQTKLAELLWAADRLVERNARSRELAVIAQKAAFHSAVDSAEKTQVKKVASVSNGTTPSTKMPKYWEQGNIPWLPTGKVHDKFIRASETFITNAAIEEGKATIKSADSTLVAMIGQGKTRGTSAMLTIDAAINQNFACVTPTSIDPTFMFYSLFFSYQRLRDISQGSNQLALNCELVGNFRISNPDPATQTEVGKGLLLAEDAIDRISEHVTSSKSLLKSLINQIF